MQIETKVDQQHIHTLYLSAAHKSVCATSKEVRIILYTYHCTQSTYEYIGTQIISSHLRGHTCYCIIYYYHYCSTLLSSTTSTSNISYY